MKSIKPGRGPSLAGGVIGILMIIFGVCWTINAGMSNSLYTVFGVIWIFIAVIQTVYNFKNAMGENRFSEYDITDDEEERDPLNAYFGSPRSSSGQRSTVDSKFCPYCGTSVGGDFLYCNGCGKKLP